MGRRAAGSYFGTIEERKLKSGKSYRAKYTVPGLGRKTAPFTFKSRAAARAWLDECERAIKAGTWTEDFGSYKEAPKDVTLGKVWDTLSQDKLTSGDWGRAHYTAQRSYWENHVEPHWGKDRELASITRADVNAWRLGPLKERKRVHSQAWALFTQLLRYAINMELTTLTRNPAQGLSVGRPKRKEPESFTMEQIVEYLRAAQPEDRAMLALAGLAGLRSGEIRALERQHIDLQNKTIRIEQGVTRYQAEDGEWITEAKPEPKTRAGNRTIPMSTQLAGVLKEYLQDNPRLPKALLFQRADGGPLKQSAVTKAHKSALRTMGLLPSDSAWREMSKEEKAEWPHPGVHDLRASYSQWLAENNVQAKVMCQLLGWDDIKMALDVYARVRPDHLESVAALQEQALAGLNFNVEGAN